MFGCCLQTGFGLDELKLAFVAVCPSLLCPSWQGLATAATAAQAQAAPSAAQPSSQASFYQRLPAQATAGVAMQPILSSSRTPQAPFNRYLVRSCLLFFFLQNHLRIEHCICKTFLCLDVCRTMLLTEQMACHSSF